MEKGPRGRIQKERGVGRRWVWKGSNFDSPSQMMTNRLKNNGNEVTSEKGGTRGDKRCLWGIITGRGEQLYVLVGS